MTHTLAIVGGTVVAVIVNETSGVLEYIVLLGAALGAMSLIRHKVIRPVIAFIGRVDSTLEDLRGLPRVHTRLDELQAAQERQAGRLESIENSLGAMASTERLSIRRMIQSD